MKIEEIVEKYQQIGELLAKRYPIQDKEKRIFAYVTKVVEEFGELAEVTLAKANLQRESKNLTDLDQSIESEFADVFGSLMLLGLESGVNIDEAVTKKIESTLARLKQEKVSKT